MPNVVLPAVPSSPPDEFAGRPLRIQEAARSVGLTPRAIRHYEEMGLLRPGRSEGSYRLYEPADLDRLRTIRSLRDDAGFSVTDIAELLDDDDHRDRAKEKWRSTADPLEQRRIAIERLSRLDRRLSLLDAKIARLTAMADDARTRKARVEVVLAGLGDAR
jgi:DNA-binding transcriptional MerR regulator